MHSLSLTRYIPFITLVCCAVALAAPVVPRKNGSSLGSRDGDSFAADSSIDVAGILAAVKSATSTPASSGKYADGHGSTVQVYGDWMSLKGVQAYSFMADMDVDCDGVDKDCPGNQDGQGETSYGDLDARKVPFYVLPEKFVDVNEIKGNSVGAIICGGKMFYAIMGDTNGDSPELIGEASLLVAQTCFPSEGLNGNKGHDGANVAYIVFGSQVQSGIDPDSPTIDIGALKTLGDKRAKLLQQALGL